MKIKLMIFRRYFLIVLLTFPFVASAQLFRPLNLGFNGGERQGNFSLPIAACYSLQTSDRHGSA